MCPRICKDIIEKQFHSLLTSPWTAVILLRPPALPFPPSPLSRSRASSASETPGPCTSLLRSSWSHRCLICMQVPHVCSWASTRQRRPPTEDYSIEASLPALLSSSCISFLGILEDPEFSFVGQPLGNWRKPAYPASLESLSRSPHCHLERMSSPHWDHQCSQKVKVLVTSVMSDSLRPHGL